MPGPKAGPRPADFDEDVIKKSRTFKNWQNLLPGQKIRYACREFEKGRGDDEERLLRRIMIARRNNIRDHEVLKKARAKIKGVVIPPHHQSLSNNTNNVGVEASAVAASIPQQDSVTFNTTTAPAAAAPPPAKRKRRRWCTGHTLSEEQVEAEMDIPAVEATRSYRAWLALADGQELVYNQKYVKGREGHDWLLKKNIWRRMRYRRDNKKMVEKLKDIDPLSGNSDTPVAADNVPVTTIADTKVITTNMNATVIVEAPTKLGKRKTREETQSVDVSAGGGVLTSMSDDALLVAPILKQELTLVNFDEEEAASQAAVAAAVATSSQHLDDAAIEAAVAAAECFEKTGVVADATVAEDLAAAVAAVVHNPPDSAALDAAARLAAAASGGHIAQSGDDGVHGTINEEDWVTSV